MVTYRPGARELRQLRGLLMQLKSLNGPYWMNQKPEEAHTSDLWRETWLYPPVEEGLAILNGTWSDWIRKNR